MSGSGTAMAVLLELWKTRSHEDEDRVDRVLKESADDGQLRDKKQDVMRGRQW